MLEWLLSNELNKEIGESVCALIKTLPWNLCGGLRRATKTLRIACIVDVVPKTFSQALESFVGPGMTQMMK
jgi:hypothetical protein